MRLPLVALALSVASPAFAGGFGVLGTTGLRGETVYFYDSSNNYAQYKQPQLNMNFGGGMEFILGDRDDKIIGVFRGYYLQDAPQGNPAESTTTVDPGNVVANVRDEARHIGAGTFGVSWGLLGDPDGFQLTAITAAGSGFLTDDHTEFLMLQVGPGITYRVNDDLQAFADVEYTVRHRKGFSHGTSMYAGVRYLFD